MYETVLFPTDGSDESFHALEHAIDVAETYGATLHALYVVETDYGSAGFDDVPVNVDAILEARRADGARALERVEARAERTGTTVVTAVREGGVVHREILDYADENDADVIVMGTHGRRGLDRWLLGSVTERVVRTSPIPVLTVRGESDADD